MEKALRWQRVRSHELREKKTPTLCLAAIVSGSYLPEAALRSGLSCSELAHLSFSLAPYCGSEAVHIEIERLADEAEGKRRVGWLIVHEPRSSTFTYITLSANKIVDCPLKYRRK
jgi:hypothetical protein